MIIIANFYDDLFKALKQLDQKGYKYDCFSRFIRDEAMAEQLEHARKSALDYYTNSSRA